MKRLKPIESLILTICGSKVLIDADLAAIYGVETRALNQPVKRNSERFPKDFIFQLNAEEKLEVITNCDHLARLKFAKSLPFAFTEHGAAHSCCGHMKSVPPRGSRWVSMRTHSCCGPIKSVPWRGRWLHISPLKKKAHHTAPTSWSERL
jgi:hypothetical protein